VTQKRKDMFDLQVAKRLTEVHALELAIEEIIYGNRLLWDYGHFYDDPNTPQMLNHSKARNREPGGTCYAVRLDDDGVNQLFIAMVRLCKGIVRKGSHTQFLRRICSWYDERGG
jgi:hypothetical protein